MLHIYIPNSDDAWTVFIILDIIIFCIKDYKRLCLMVLHSQQWFLFSVLLDSEKGSVWDLWALDWVQQKAECLRFCIGRSVTPAGQLPVSTDIDYEFGSRNPYNFLQVTYYKVSYFSGSHKGLYHDNC